MTVIIRTEQKSNAKGTTRITAKGRGKQRTVTYDPAKSLKANHASAAGVLGNVILTNEEQAKIHHPTGRRRFSYDSNDSGSRWGFELDV